MYSLTSKTTYNIINAAMEVYNELGYGFLETTYREAMKIELTMRKFDVKTEKQLKVYYKNHLVGINYADIILNNEIIIELKTCKQLIKAHYKQLQHYMKVTGIMTGFVFNFNPEKLDWHRVFITCTSKHNLF